MDADLRTACFTHQEYLTSRTKPGSPSPAFCCPPFTHAAIGHPPKITMAICKPDYAIGQNIEDQYFESHQPACAYDLRKFQGAVTTSCTTIHHGIIESVVREVVLAFDAGKAQHLPRNPACNEKPEGAFWSPSCCIWKIRLQRRAEGGRGTSTSGRRCWSGRSGFSAIALKRFEPKISELVNSASC